MDDVCARWSCREMRKHGSAYCSDDCYAEDIWAVVKAARQRARHGIFPRRHRNLTRV